MAGSITTPSLSRACRRVLRPGALVAACLFAGAIAAGPLEDGVAAWKRSDYKTAFRLLQPLAAEGDNEPQLYVGIMFENGQGVKRDPDTAYRWYRIAADQEYAPAQTNLGTLYATGQGVPQSYAEAGAWWRRAADQGDASALSNLGVLYHAGKGVMRDLVESYKWYELAASRYPPDQGAERERALRGRDAVAARLAPAELAEAKRRVRDWRARPKHLLAD